MINNKYVIGVCITKMHNISNAVYLDYLHKLSVKSDVKLIIFNSFVDFFRKDNDDDCAASIYGIMNYEIIDAVVLVKDGFCDIEVADNIIKDARANDTPVVLVNGQQDGCWSVSAEYEKSYKEILRHIIRDHNVTDSVFIAGNRENDPDSVCRIGCYKEVLEENGLVFDESRVEYGGYWHDPTKAIVERLIAGGKLPQAIICSNDHMAFTVCDVLEENGCRVPEDIIVTGFDGVPESDHFAPRLTTCKEDPEGLAGLTLKAVKYALEKRDAEELKLCYKPFISESCGCQSICPDNFRKSESELYREFNDYQLHEDFMFNRIGRMLSITDMNTFYDNVSRTLLNKSSVCMNSNFLASAMDMDYKNVKKGYTKNLIVISSIYTDGDKTERMSLSEMVPDIEEWAESEDSYILSALYTGGMVCGYTAARFNNLVKVKHKIKRVQKCIMIALNVAMNNLRQAKLKLSIEQASVTNPTSGLPNLKGTTNWFEDFSASPENHKKCMTISVYALQKYTYIYENYGAADIEEDIRFISETLKIANPKNCFIGHITEDSFVIINYYNDSSEISETINNATSVFYSMIEGFNGKDTKEYYVEVNCGCTVIDSGWIGGLESFIKVANSEMYMNRLKMGSTPVHKDRMRPTGSYKSLDLLIEKNLFTYHFQPIVSAKTGEIFAYEALMRTDPIIGLNPLEVLDAAKDYDKLYDIERATLFNVMNRYASDQESFGNAKVFINSIPGYFLNDEDIGTIKAKYSSHFGKFVFEITEQGTVSDDELDSIKKLSEVNAENMIAIDDYGTGHSNIVNLMRYKPQVIKIDRFLISDINNDRNKQMFLLSTIEFAKLNNIRVLAEGVETSDELQTVIRLGVDYIQGYYTARPAPEPIKKLPEKIRMEILTSNAMVS